MSEHICLGNSRQANPRQRLQLRKYPICKYLIITITSCALQIDQDLSRSIVFNFYEDQQKFPWNRPWPILNTQHIIFNHFYFHFLGFVHKPCSTKLSKRKNESRKRISKFMEPNSNIMESEHFTFFRFAKLEWLHQRYLYLLKQYNDA